MPRLDIRELGAIFVGGAAGAVLRVELSQAYPSAADSWPWIVFAINVSGTFVLGYAVTRLQRHPSRWAYVRPLIGTGFCGAYTTFSTMQLELLKMADRGRYGLAAAYAAASIAAGYLAVVSAIAIAKRVRLVV
jgi:CrcB protein